MSFAYNGRDDRVSMTTGTGTRRFVYSADGRVLGEYGASASDVKAEFVWALPEVANDNQFFGRDDGAGGYMPLAVATPDSGGAIQLNWVHGNHLCVPLITTDAGGNAATTPNDYLAPGFPGQSRMLADLYYNRYRDFDPTTGRYIQADPIGLDGGQNGYAYAENNPMRIIDPMGTCPMCLVIPGICAAGGCETLGALGFGALWHGTHPIAPSKSAYRAPGRRQKACSKDPEDPQDPCAGLRFQVQDHERKLAEYMRNPIGSDNKGFLKRALEQKNANLYKKIYDTRIEKLKGQIEKFKKLLKECEENNDPGN